MASTYDKASLVMIPSGTKASKIFSQKPVNGDGDFTFSRSTAATRVNADGNIEKETQNLLLYSNTFSNANWVKNGTTITGSQAGYDGSNNASLLLSTTTGFPRVEQTISASGVLTFSVYLKEQNDSFALLRTYGSTSQVWFDLTDGSVANEAGDDVVDSSIEDIGSGWYRASVTISGSITKLRIYPASAYGVYSTASNGIYIQDAQLEQGLVARDYIETTTAAVEGGITDNVPRLDYTDSSCPALLLEPQRTNLSLQSEYLDTSPSVKDASTIEVNGTTSPSGLDDACLFTETTANDRHGFYQYITIAAGALTASIFTKEIDRRYIHFQSDATGSGQSSYVDLQDGSVVSEGTGWTLSTEDYGNDWYRIKATCTAVAGNKYFIWGVSQNGTTNSYAGSTSSDFTFYGLQVEAGSYATSYIPTYGTSVTRNKDVAARYTLDNLVFNPSESWSFLYEAEFPAYTSGSAPILHFDIAGTTDDIYLFANYTGSNMGINVYLGAGNGGYPFGFGANDAGILNQRNKMCLTYDGDALKYFINGSLFNSTTGVSFTEGTTSIKFNSFGTLPVTAVGELLTFPTALTNQEAIDLTTI